MERKISGKIISKVVHAKRLKKCFPRTQSFENLIDLQSEQPAQEEEKSFSPDAINSSDQFEESVNFESEGQDETGDEQLRRSRRVPVVPQRYGYHVFSSRYNGIPKQRLQSARVPLRSRWFNHSAARTPHDPNSVRSLQ